MAAQSPSPSPGPKPRACSLRGDDTSDGPHLAAPESLLRYVIRHDPNAIAVYDNDLRYVFVSERYLRDYGLDGQDVIGRHHYEVFPEMPQRWKDVHQRVLNGAVECCEEDHFERLDGTVDYNRWECRPWYQPDGQIGGMVTYTEVLTERKRAEQELRHSEAHLRGVFRCAPVGIGVVVDRVLTEINAYFCQMVGYAPEELIGRNARMLYPTQEDYEYVGREKYRQIREQGTGSVETKMIRKDGAVIHVILSSTPLDPEDLSAGVTFSALDITHRVEVEEQLRQAQKMDAVGQLAGGIAHDFNNLLQAISGYTDLALAESAPAGQPAGEYLREVKRAADRAASLVRQLLTFSRRETLRPRRLELSVLAGDLMHMLRHVLGERIELHLDTLGEGDVLIADAGQLEQVIVNLCLNARDAMPSGGQLTIGVHGRELEQPSNGLADLPAGTYVCLTVADTGTGIQPEIQGRVFEPFFTTKEVGQGTGLGLATVYAIVQQLGGHVDFTSQVGRGTEFRVLLPAAGQAPAEEVAADRPAGQSPGGRETILLAEDSPPVRNLTRAVLAKAGYTVLVARDGAEAIELIGQKGRQLDAAILDVVMPRKGGREVAEALAAVNPDCPTLFCSGYSLNSIGDELVPSDGELIQKPYAPATLLERLRQVLDARRDSGS